jgi:hypothetical protein
VRRRISGHRGIKGVLKVDLRQLIYTIRSHFGNVLGIMFASVLNFGMLFGGLYYQLEIILYEWMTGQQCYYWPFFFMGCWDLSMARDAWYMIYAAVAVFSWLVLAISIWCWSD